MSRVSKMRLYRAIMVENPSLYVDLPGHELDEADFLSQLAARTGCGLLVDVNNIYVSAANLNFSAESRIDAIPASIVGRSTSLATAPIPIRTVGS